MATDLETLIVRLEAQMKGYEREMQRARNMTDRQTRAIESRFTKTNSNIRKAMGGLGTALRGVLAGLSVREVAQFSDSFTKAQNALRVTGLEGEALTATFDKVAAIADRTSAPIEAMATLFGKVSLAQKELGATSGEMLALTESVGQALLVQGTSGAQAQGALQQLGQALAGGKLEMQEFGSIMDGLFPIAQAAANGIEEAGGSVAKLRTLVREGKVSSEAFFRGIEAGSGGLATQAASAVRTYGQEWELVENALIKAAGAINKLTDTSGGVSSFVDAVVADIGRIPAGVQSTIDEINRLIVVFNTLKAAARQRFEWAGILPPESRFDQAFGAQTNAGSMAGYKPPPAAGPAARTVSLKNFAVPGDSKGRKSARERESEFAREIAQIKERTAALAQEATTVGQSEGEIAKAKAAFELLRAAKESNVEVDARVRASIDGIAAAYGKAVTELDAAEQAIRDAREAMQNFEDIATGGVKGFVSDLMDGVDAATALRNALKRVGDQLLDMALSSALKGLFTGGGGGGGFGDFFSGLLGGRRASGGPVQSGKTYLVGENGPEMVRFGRNGTVVPNSLVGSKGGAGGPAVQVNVINQAGIPVEQQRNQSGGVDIIIPMLESALGERASRGKGALYKATSGRAGGRNLIG